MKMRPFRLCLGIFSFSFAPLVDTPLETPTVFLADIFLSGNAGRLFLNAVSRQLKFSTPHK
jgi:hypothetical protein